MVFFYGLSIMFPQITLISAEAHSITYFPSCIPAQIALMVAEIPFGQDVLFNRESSPKGLQRTAGQNPAYCYCHCAPNNETYVLTHNTMNTEHYTVAVKKCKIFYAQGNKTVLL